MHTDGLLAIAQRPVLGIHVPRSHGPHREASAGSGDCFFSDAHEQLCAADSSSRIQADAARKVRAEVYERRIRVIYYEQGWCNVGELGDRKSQRRAGDEWGGKGGCLGRDCRSIGPV